MSKTCNLISLYRSSSKRKDGFENSIDIATKSPFLIRVLGDFNTRLKSGHQRCSVKKDVLKNFAKPMPL